MLTDVLETENMLVKYDSELGYCDITLTHGSNQVELFKSDLMQFLDILRKYHPDKNLWNLALFEIIIEPELQGWIDKNINNTETDLGVKREAFILPDDMIIELSIEQTMDESYGKSIITKLFLNYEQAKDWLFDER